MPLLSADVIQATWDHMAAWTASEADREAKRFIERQPVVNAAVLALTEDAGERPAAMALYCASAISECYEAARGRALPRVHETVMDEALDGVERWGRALEHMDEQLFARRALYGRDHSQPYLVVQLAKYLAGAASDGEIEADDFEIIFSVLLAVIRAFDRVSGAPRKVPSMEQVLRELSVGPLPRLRRGGPCLCGSGRRYGECCLRRGSAEAGARRPPNA